MRTNTSGTAARALVAMLMLSAVADAQQAVRPAPPAARRAGPAEEPVKKSAPDVVRTFPPAPRLWRAAEAPIGAKAGRSARHGRPEGLHYGNFFTGSEAGHYVAQAAAAPVAQPTAVDAARRVAAGAALYKKKGCYECHVDDAQGGPQGPRLGPNPIPLPRFTAYVRNPTGDMPPFTERVLSNQELADLYAFLQARPQPKPVASIPLLAP